MALHREKLRENAVDIFGKIERCFGGVFKNAMESGNRGGKNRCKNAGNNNRKIPIDGDEIGDFGVISVFF